MSLGGFCLVACESEAQVPSLFRYQMKVRLGYIYHTFLLHTTVTYGRYGPYGPYDDHHPMAASSLAGCLQLVPEPGGNISKVKSWDLIDEDPGELKDAPLEAHYYGAQAAGPFRVDFSEKVIRFEMIWCAQKSLEKRNFFPFL